MNKLIAQLYKKKIVILDGATGTALQQNGLKTGVCPEKWAIENPTVLKELQEKYVKAGSDILYSFTFGANKLKLEEYGLGSETFEINKQLASISCSVAKGKALVAGSISSCGRHLKPYGDLDFEVAVDSFKEQVRGLLAGGVDLFVIETMSDIQEARAALLAVKESSSLPVMVSITFDAQGKTLTGTDPLTALQILQSMGADVVGCNCSTGPLQMIEVIKKMKPFATVPLLAKPNAGMPRLEKGETCFDLEPALFAKYAKDLVNEGVNFIGGCCGTTPEYIRELKDAISDTKPIKPQVHSVSVITSSRKSVFVGTKYPFAIVGERINPTGKKLLQAELKEGKMTEIATLAAAQIQNAAQILDVNVGMPGINEMETMVQVIEYLASSCEAPLCIDSSSPEVLEAAVRIYPGRALINSVSLESAKLKAVLPLVAKYGSMVVALPISDEGLPESLKEMKDNLKSIIKEADILGIPANSIVADGMVMAASAKQENVKQTLDYIDWCSNKLGLTTIVGLSNVSFGLPERKWVNNAFLAMAMGKGLSLAIANPSSELIVNTVRSIEVLLGKDENCSNYIESFANPVSGSQISITSQRKKEAMQDENIQTSTLKCCAFEKNSSYREAVDSDMSKDLMKSAMGQRLYNAILSGDRSSVVDLFKGLIQDRNTANEIMADQQSVTVSEALNGYVIPAITEVGRRFGEGIYFLPQLLLSAEAVKKVMDFVETDASMAGALENVVKKGTIVLATVKGDIHDIGKNIVALLLKNHGYQVIDLGKDVAASDIVEAAIKVNADILGLSALMTTTMLEMKEVIKIAKDKKLKAKIIIGGAVVTKKYADEIGADGYSEDANEAVLLVKRLLLKV